MGWQCEVVTDAAIDAAFLDVLSGLVQTAAAREPSAPTGDWSLTIRLTNDETISAIHEDFFGDASPTDVMSFPSGESLMSASGYLGDIVISVDTAADNAVDEGHSTRREIAFLALHGLLHLCGHTDSTDAERSAMLGRQTALLEEFEAAKGASW